MPWAVLEGACPSLRGCLFRPLVEAILLPVPTFETGFGESFFSLRIPKPPKLWSSSSTRRSHEDIFFRLQSASPGIHPAPSGTVPVSVCLAPTQQVSDQRLLDQGLAVGSEVEMFRSTASSLISSTRSLFLPGGSSFFRPGRSSSSSWRSSCKANRSCRTVSRSARFLDHNSSVTAASTNSCFLMGGQSNWFVACLKLQLFSPRLESFSHQNLDGQRP